MTGGYEPGVGQRGVDGGRARQPPWPPYSGASRPVRGTRRRLLIGVAVAVVIGLACVAALLALRLRDRDMPVRPVPDRGSEAAVEVGPPRLHALGRAARDGDVAFKVDKFRSGVHSIGSGKGAVRASGTFVLVTVLIKNRGSAPVLVLPTLQRLKDSSGKAYAVYANAPLPSSRRLQRPVRPGELIATTMVFQVPRGTVPASIELHGGGMSRGLAVRL